MLKGACCFVASKKKKKHLFAEKHIIRIGEESIEEELNNGTIMMAFLESDNSEIVWFSSCYAFF